MTRLALLLALAAATVAAALTHGRPPAPPPPPVGEVHVTAPRPPWVGGDLGGGQGEGI